MSGIGLSAVWCLYGVILKDRYIILCRIIYILNQIIQVFLIFLLTKLGYNGQKEKKTKTPKETPKKKVD